MVLCSKFLLFDPQDQSLPMHKFAFNKQFVAKVEVYALSGGMPLMMVQDEHGFSLSVSQHVLVRECCAGVLHTPG